MDLDIWIYAQVIDSFSYRTITRAKSFKKVHVIYPLPYMLKQMGFTLYYIIVL